MKKKYLSVLALLLIASNAIYIPAEENEETSQDTVPSSMITTDQFLEDIVKSHDDRALRSEKYTNEELNKMDNKEYIEAQLYYAEGEEWFLNKYKEAAFEDLNVEFLSGMYCDALELEFSCAEDFFKDKDYGLWNEAWVEARSDRANVLVELVDNYKATLSDIDTLRSYLETQSTSDTVGTRNKDVDRATVQKVQQLLNDVGFLCGAADGVAGNLTTKSIERFQQMYGYKPVDGIIDDELVEQLETALEEKQGTEDE